MVKTIVLVCTVIIGLCVGARPLRAQTAALQDLAGLSACTESPAGTLCGRVVAPDGKTPLTSAKIEQVLPEGTSTTSLGAEACYSNALGDFYCQCASPGEAVSFRASSILVDVNFTATCTANGVSADSNASDTIPHPVYVALTDEVKPMAVVSGIYDAVQVILRSVFKCYPYPTTKGGTACTKITTYYDLGEDFPTPHYDQLLKNGDLSLETYRAIFLNCGMGTELMNDPVVSANLSAYVEAGGLIYASDWAYVYLESAFPELIEWYSPDDASGLTAASESAEAALAQEALVGQVNPMGDVESTAEIETFDGQSLTLDDDYLKDFLIAQGFSADGSTISVPFDMENWAVMTAKSDGVYTLLSTPVLETGLVGGDYSPYAQADGSRFPIAVSYCDASSNGGVFLTSYHIESELGTELTAQESSMMFLVTNSHSRCLQRQATSSTSQEPSSGESSPEANSDDDTEESDAADAGDKPTSDASDPSSGDKPTSDASDPSSGDSVPDSEVDGAQGQTDDGQSGDGVDASSGDAGGDAGSDAGGEVTETDAESQDVQTSSGGEAASDDQSADATSGGAQATQANTVDINGQPVSDAPVISEEDGDDASDSGVRAFSGTISGGAFGCSLGAVW